MQPYINILSLLLLQLLPFKCTLFCICLPNIFVLYAYTLVYINSYMNAYICIVYTLVCMWQCGTRGSGHGYETQAAHSTTKTTTICASPVYIYISIYILYIYVYIVYYISIIYTRSHRYFSNAFTLLKLSFSVIVYV